MISVYKENWKGIPVLVVVNAQKINEPLPVLTYFHGYTSAKEHNLPLAYLLAEKDYRVVLPDCLLHGEREEDISNSERHMQFFNIVGENLKDLQTIKETLEEKELLLDGRFGVAGTSMGGITTSAALTQYSWIKAAAILMGSPKLTDYAGLLVKEMQNNRFNFTMSDQEIDQTYQALSKIDLSKQPEKLFERPLFFWHGEADQVVPFDHSYRFYEEVVPQYKNPENIRFLREVGQGHKVSRFAILETVDWFDLQL
ncbi:prolyl oligopeptidase family serine peptidase [Sediminibacillus massiliensis]|uniref:prolyl oligopeptidase family serine peptidase n=1 Tax=Sediminibacillus massiliensis TaxID=1926277 RepID=UPI000988310E|nr:prolyl oligopeptidase family serine peptidase [Sediminibacillus massiliensis]